MSYDSCVPASPAEHNELIEQQKRRYRQHQIEHDQLRDAIFFSNFSRSTVLRMREVTKQMDECLQSVLGERALSLADTARSANECGPFFHQLGDDRD